MHRESLIKVIIVIPVYNHGRTLRNVVRQCLEMHDQVLVVDDGSTDGGPDTIEDLPIHRLRHDQNMGKGAALCTAARHARTLGMTHMITVDADGQHDPADIGKFLHAIDQYPEAIIVGKRNFDAANVPGPNRFGRSFSNFWLRLQTGVSLGDTQSGFRAYPLFVFEALKLRQRGYAFEIEILVKSAWAGVALRQVPVSVHYPPGTQRISHFHLFWDNLRLAILNTHFTMRSVTPWPHRKIMDTARKNRKVSVLRPMYSIRLLLSENTTPRQLAFACALGVFLGALPLIACHTIVILFASGFLRLNKVAAVAASQLCMPPIVPALCIETGYYFRHGRWLTEISMETLGYQGLQRLWEWVLGSLAVAPVLALVVGSIIYILAVAVENSATCLIRKKETEKS